MNDSMMIRKEAQFTHRKEMVWKMLTLPEMTRQYMFGCDVLSDWQQGAPIQWKGRTEEGKEIIYVQGSILDIKPREEVTFTMFDPNLGYQDIPSNYARLTYRLEETDAGTQLTILQSYPADAENVARRFEESEKGWDMVIPLMQQLLDRQ